MHFEKFYLNNFSLKIHLVYLTHVNTLNTTQPLDSALLGFHTVTVIFYNSKVFYQSFQVNPVHFLIKKKGMFVYTFIAQKVSFCQFTQSFLIPNLRIGQKGTSNNHCVFSFKM